MKLILLIIAIVLFILAALVPAGLAFFAASFLPVPAGS